MSPSCGAVVVSAAESVRVVGNAVVLMLVLGRLDRVGTGGAGARRALAKGDVGTGGGLMGWRFAIMDLEFW